MHQAIICHGYKSNRSSPKTIHVCLRRQYTTRKRDYEISSNVQELNLAISWHKNEIIKSLKNQIKYRTIFCYLWTGQAACWIYSWLRKQWCNSPQLQWLAPGMVSGRNSYECNPLSLQRCEIWAGWNIQPGLKASWKLLQIWKFQFRNVTFFG